MIIKCYADYTSRQIRAYSPSDVIAVYQDYASDIIRIELNAADFSDVNIDLSTAVKKILYIVDSVDDEDILATIVTGGWKDENHTVYYVDWELPGSITDDIHHIEFALSVKSVSNNTVNISWFSVTKSFDIVRTLKDTDASGSETPEEVATNAELIAVLQGEMSNVGNTLTNHGNRLTALEETVSRHTETLSGITEDISDIRDKISEIVSEDEWEAVKENIILGYGPRLYPVGTIITVNCREGAPYQYIDFIVIDHDHDEDILSSNEHTMTVLMRYCINGVMFDSPESFIEVTSAYSPGMYSFTIPDYDSTYGGNASYQFTLTQAVPIGGQMVFNWAYQTQASAGTVSTYSSASSATPIETVSVSAGSGGTFLGTLNGSASNLNHIHRARYGSNNYEESGIRQWANSDQAKGHWYHQSSKFDRRPSYADSMDGFLTYLDPEFVNILCNVSHKNRTNTVYDENGTTTAYNTVDRVFLLSNEEVGFSTESSINTGSVYAYFSGATDADRIGYDISNTSTARYWWLRTPHPSHASDERRVYTSGALYSHYADNGHAARLACVI